MIKGKQCTLILVTRKIFFHLFLPVSCLITKHSSGILNHAFPLTSKVK